MECHKCKDRTDIEAGKYERAAYNETPCAKCELKEYSDLTMEYDAGKESRSQNPEARSGDEEAQLPISVMNEVVFRLMSMTPETRDAVCWRFLGMGYRDIAVLQGVTTAAVEKRHWKAMKKWPALCALFAMKAARHVRRKPAGSGQRTVDRRSR